MPDTADSFPDESWRPTHRQPFWSNVRPKSGKPGIGCLCGRKLNLRDKCSVVNHLRVPAYPSSQLLLYVQGTCQECPSFLNGIRPEPSSDASPALPCVFLFLWL